MRTNRATILAATAAASVLVGGAAEARLVTTFDDPALQGRMMVGLSGLKPPDPKHFTFTIGADPNAIIATVDTPYGLYCPNTGCWLWADPASVPITITFSPPVAALAIGYAGGSTGPGATYTVAIKGANGQETATEPAVGGPQVVGAAEIGAISELDITGADLGTCLSGCYELFHYMYVVPGQPAGDAADLAITVQPTAASVAAFQQLSYQLTASNLGPGSAVEVAMIDLPPSTFSLDFATAVVGDLAAGASSPPLAVAATAPAVLDCHEPVVDVAVITSTVRDPAIANNVQLSVLPVRPGPEMCDVNADMDCNGLVGCGDPACNCPLSYVDIGNGDLPGPPYPTVSVRVVSEPPPPAPPAPLPNPAAAPPPAPAQQQACFNVNRAPLPAYCCDPLPPPEGSTHPSPEEWGMECRAVDPNFLEATPPVNAAGRGVITPGEAIAYIVHYENVGNVDAHGVQIVAVVDANLDAQTLAMGAGGAFDAASRTITWQDAVLPPHTPRAVSFSARLRGDAPPRTRVRARATVIFPDAFPPSRTDTNFVEHVVPHPDHPLAPDLAVYRCERGAGDQWTVILENRGFGFAYDASATITGAPRSVVVTQPTARFANVSDPYPDRLASVVPLASTASLDTVSFTSPGGVDPCPVMTWEIRYYTSGGAETVIHRQAAADANDDGVPDYLDGAGGGARMSADGGAGASSGCACDATGRRPQMQTAAALLALVLAVRRRRRRRVRRVVIRSAPYRRP